MDYCFRSLSVERVAVACSKSAVVPFGNTGWNLSPLEFIRQPSILLSDEAAAGWSL